MIIIAWIFWMQRINISNKGGLLAQQTWNIINTKVLILQAVDSGSKDPHVKESLAQH